MMIACDEREITLPFGLIFLCLFILHGLYCRGGGGRREYFSCTLKLYLCGCL